jgi:hypothetical protein
MTGGQPARATEILSVRHSNTVKGGHRNIHMVVFVTRYHKGYVTSGDVKIIHRYLPREVGELVVWYLWLVLPFQRQLEAMMCGALDVGLNSGDHGGWAMGVRTARAHPQAPGHRLRATTAFLEWRR